MAGLLTRFFSLEESDMKFVPVLIALLFATCSIEAGERWSKAKGKGAWAFAVAKSQCACGDTCQCAVPAQPAAKPEPTTVETPTIKEHLIVGSCSSGSCGTSTTYSSGLFRRRR